MGAPAYTPHSELCTDLTNSTPRNEMDRMWSPWRSKHIETLTRGLEAPDDRGSLFVRLAEDDRDVENLILWRGERVYVVMNRYPYNNGHLLVVPYRQVAQYDDLTAEEQIEIARTIDRCIRWLRHALSPDGFNVGMNLGKAAGAGVPEHLHAHVVPRWNGDTNFMPTVADLKVIPEGMNDTFQKLRDVVAADEGET